jgi:2-oxoglutarate ferredoxin oxidoreductase subunit alpha
MAKPPADRHELDRATILFCGDSGDGMQLTGSQFTATSALFGNDVSTLPDYPSEIRAPAGSLAGVSAFQISFAGKPIHTPGDYPDALVAMNPAALKVYLSKLKPKGILIVNRDAFTKANLKKAGYAENPLEDPELARAYRLHAIPITTLTVNALEGMNLNNRAKQRCKNFFALGLAYWLYGRSLDPTLRWIDEKFSRAPKVADANRRAVKTGYHYGETAESFAVSFRVEKSATRPGAYRIITGNEAAALGFTTAARLAGKPLVYSSYPITPATDVLHELARYRHFGIKTFQAEDEIAAVSSTVGAAYAGELAITTTSGPGMLLKQEALNLAVMVELPLVVVDIQRAGPSTGMPTKTEQADLLMAIHGRSSDSPMPVLAPSTPGDCFHIMLEAFRIAVKYMTPVCVLSDGYLANSSEPWLIPDVDALPRHSVEYRTDPEGFLPYMRNPETLARPWAIPGTPGLEHRIGGIEKEDGTGNVSYMPANHARMTQLRAEKLTRVAQDIAPVEVDGPDRGKLVVVGWGGTCGALTAAVEQARERGCEVSRVHLRHLNPFPANLGEVLSRFERILVPELNTGQLSRLLRAEYLAPCESLCKIEGQPFKVAEVRERIEEIVS